MNSRMLATLATNLVDEQFGLPAKGLPKVIVEFGEEAEVGGDGIQVARLQPLRSEVVGQGVGTGIREQAPRLPHQHFGLVKIAIDGGRQQRVVGEAAPQKERREANSRSLIGYAVLAGMPEGSRSTRNRKCGLTRIALRAASKPASKPLSSRASRKNRRGVARVAGRNGPPIRALHESGQDTGGEGFLVGVVLRAFRRRVAVDSRCCLGRSNHGARDRDLVDGGTEARMTVKVEMRGVRLAPSLQQVRSDSSET